MSEVCSGEQTFAQLRTGLISNLAPVDVKQYGHRDGTASLLGAHALRVSARAWMLCLDGDDDVELNVLGCRVDISETNCDQCCFTFTETTRLIRTGSPGRPPQISHSS